MNYIISESLSRFKYNVLANMQDLIKFVTEAKKAFNQFAVNLINGWLPFKILNLIRSKSLIIDFSSKNEIFAQRIECGDVYFDQFYYKNFY